MRRKYTCSQTNNGIRHRIAFAPARKPYHILFTHKNCDFGAISAAERSCVVLISKVESHIISDRFCATLWCSVIGQPPPQALCFWQGRGERLVMNRKEPWEGHIIIERETSGYEVGDRVFGP